MDEYQFHSIVSRINASFYILLIALSINMVIVGVMILNHNSNLLTNIKQIQQGMNLYAESGIDE